MGSPSTHPDDSSRKTQPLLEGTNINPKDSGRNTQLVDRGQPKALVTNQSEVESDTDTLILTTVADIQALLGDSRDELKDDSDEEMLEAGEESDEEFIHIEDFLATNFRQYENIDASLRNYEKIITQFKSEHVTGLNRILTNLQEVHNAVKEDPALNKKVPEATNVESLLAAVIAQNDHLTKWVESTALIAWSVGPQMTRIENTQATIQSDIASLKINTADIKAMMTKIFCAFKGHPTEETPSLTEGEKDDMITEETVSKTADVKKEHVQEPQDTEPIPIIILTDPIVEVQVPQPENPLHTTPKPDRGKDIARDTDESLRKLMLASKEVRQDHDGPVLIPFEINGKLYHLTNEQIQAHMEMEEQKEKASQEARL
ncbi:hypothetical protein Tco_1541855 [Tanacetum coccineum]